MSLIISRFQELPSDLVKLICLFTGKFKYDKNGNLQSIINIHDYVHIDYHLQDKLHKRSLTNYYDHNHNIIFVYYSREYNWKRVNNPVIPNEPISILKKRNNPTTIKIKKNNLRPNYKKNFRRLL